MLTCFDRAVAERFDLSIGLLVCGWVFDYVIRCLRLYHKQARTFDVNLLKPSLLQHEPQILQIVLLILYLGNAHLAT